MLHAVKTMSLLKKGCIGFIVSITVGLHANAEIVQSHLSIPVSGSGPSYNLNALFVTSTDFKRAPKLMILTHGASQDRSIMKATAFVPQASELVRLGYAVLVVERRGYGQSSVPYAEGGTEPCTLRDHASALREAAHDVLGAIKFAKQSLARQFDPNGIVLIGHSVGGLASVVAGAANPGGVIAIVNVGGGIGAQGGGIICNELNLLQTLEQAGVTSHTPTYWLYSQNDLYFPKATAERMLKSYKDAGGQAEFKELPSYEGNGHFIFGRPSTVTLWSAAIKDLRI